MLHFRSVYTLFYCVVFNGLTRAFFRRISNRERKPSHVARNKAAVVCSLTFGISGRATSTIRPSLLQTPINTFANGTWN